MSIHIPVLSHQVLHFLAPSPGKVFIDCTLGIGGHSKMILEASGGRCALYGIDADDRNLVLAIANLSAFKNVHCTRDNFENLEEISHKILQGEGRIDGILFDLGLSALHVDEPERGFSFLHTGPLDMRYDTRSALTAGEIINTWPLDSLTHIFLTYGEEHHSYRIAKAIVEYRRKQRFASTTQLADFIAQLFLPKSDKRGSGRGARTISKKFYWKRHPATRIFQSLRIAANREIEAFEKGLAAAIKIVSPGGRIVAISYHSLEDRIVKNIFRDNARGGILKILTKKPIESDTTEKKANPRSRSAKLRAAEKLITS